ncbi:MAG: hypothetical protein HYY64_19690 [Candidatus Rokubacteria bacterium]|nr:hypothetical protein [Candidatus Rokubacteria bacterium]
MKRVCCASSDLEEFHGSLVVVEANPERLLDALSRWEPPALERWMGREEI